MSLQYLVHFIQQEFLKIIYYNTRVQSAIIKQRNENKHLAKTIQWSICAHQKNLPYKSYSSSCTCNRIKLTLSTQCNRKTYPTSGNSFSSLRGMIGNMGLLFSFCLWKALLIIHLYNQVLLAIMITSLANLEQSESFHHLLSSSSYYSARP